MCCVVLEEVKEGVTAPELLAAGTEPGEQHALLTTESSLQPQGASVNFTPKLLQSVN